MANEKELKVRIKINSDTGEITFLNKEVNKLGRSFNSTDNFANKFAKRLNAFSHAVGIFIGLNETIGTSIRSGIEYNKTLESLTNGLTTLAVATSTNISSTGEQITLQEKYTLANKEALASIEKLTEINKTTPHTLAQTVEIYKSMYPSMKKVGVTQEELYDITKKLSIASGSAGIQFQQLLAGVDGLATGTVLSNSELGRFLGSLGLTNDTLKKSDNLYETINEKLRDIQPIEDYGTAISNLENSFDELAGVITEPFFDQIKVWAKDLTGLFSDLKDSINETKIELQDIGEVKGYEEYFTKMSSLGKEWQELEDKRGLGLLDWDWLPEGAINKQQKEIEGEISLLKERYQYLQLNKNFLPEGSLVAVTSSSGGGKPPKKTSKNENEDLGHEFYKAEAQFAALDELYEEKASLVSAFEDKYKQVTMNQYDYQREVLLKEVEALELAEADKLKVKEYYDTKLQEINDNQIQDFKDQEKTSKSIFDNIGDNFTNTFGTKFTDTLLIGSASFSGFANSMLEDMARIAIQSAVSPITSSLTSGIGSFFTGLFNANGNAFVNGQVQAFATGGIVSSPTFFNHSGGVGVAGEAGNELIAPMRMGNGEMGVQSKASKVVLNITNNSNSEISAEQVSEMTQTNANGESERVIGIVMNGVSRNKNGIRDMLKGM